MKEKNRKPIREITFLMLLIFLSTLLSGCGSGSSEEKATPASAGAVADGDAERGRQYFMGYAHFTHDGPPCMGCHSVGNNGLLGGGSMGPDLTDVSERLSQAEMISLLSNSGGTSSSVMQPIYTTHPLTEAEQADLIVFMESSAGQAETNREWVVIAISIGGFFAAAAVFGWIFHSRLRGVRRVLVQDAFLKQQ